jgi:hypothetical protein
VGDTGIRGSCILVGDQFSAWIPHAGFLGLKIVGILLKSNKLLSLIEAKFGDQCDVQVGEWHLSNMMADVVLVDGPADPGTLDVATRSGARLVLSTTRTRSRRKQPEGTGWKQVARERISHQFVGGITEKIVDLTIHQPSTASTIQAGDALPQAVPRDASTVLSLAEHAKFFRPAPTPEIVDPLRCINLGSEAKPIYHGRGLLPAALDRNTWVLTPFLYSPKAKREWGLRRLGIQETLACVDFPDDWAKALSETGADREFAEVQPPMACFVSGATRWLNSLFVSDNEGGSRFTSNTVPSEKELDSGATNCETLHPLFSSKIERRRNKAVEDASKYGTKDIIKKCHRMSDEEEDEWPQSCVKRAKLAPTKNEIANNSDATKTHLTTPAPKSKTQIKRLKRQNRKRHRNSLLLAVSLIEGPVTVTDEEEDEGIPVFKDAEELFPDGASGFVPCKNQSPVSPAVVSPDKFSSNQEDELKSTAEAIREQKAVKADGAAVPKHLWEENLFNKNPKWNAHKGRFRRACEVLRTGMLSYWKTLVRRSLVNWIALRYPSIDTGHSKKISLVKRMPPQGRGRVRWREYDWNPKVRERKFPSFTGEVTQKFMWEKEGLKAYSDWWHSRMKIASWDLIPGIDAVARAANASWFEWDDGSRPFHWRWPEFYQKIIRDGLQVHFKSTKPKFKRPQAGTKSPDMLKRMREKLDKVRKRRYIAPGFVSSLTSFFAVPKGADDIRMVYDASVSGLNDSIWVPRFPLPTIKTHLRAVEEGTYMADLDVGEMFLNFVLHSDLRALCGVDLTLYGGSIDEFQLVAWEVWQRAAMGLKPSPYQAVQGMMIAEEIIKGNELDKDNPFRWDAVRMNLPGSKNYDPSLPWVSKIRKGEKLIACDLVIFVDDLRVTGPTREECWKAGQRAAQILNHLGLQDAPRKRRGASQAPGPWTGTILRTDLDGVFVFVSQEKWDKGKAQVEEVISMIEEDPHRLNHKRLEQVRGFLQYIMQTYSGMTPYIIGFHLTIDGWRENRAPSGWRKKEGPKQKESNSKGDGGVREEMLRMEAALGETEGSLGLSPTNVDPPKYVQAVPRFLPDLKALRALMEGDKPPLKRARCSKMATAVYSFVDASGRGFGSTFQVGSEVFFQYGQWPDRISEAESSNWRELANLVESLEAEVRDRGLTDCEIFLFTDNTTAEAAYWKGTSKSERLFELVLRLRLLEIRNDLIIHVIHVAGTRMQAQGTDGISRGDKSMGVMRGIPMEEFCPLHKTAFERSPNLKAWLTAATKLLDPVFLEPKDWFLQGQGSGNYIWSPAPAAADVVVEQLGKARHKRPSSLHLVVAPRLMTGRWRRHMTRECDFYFKIPAGACSLWDAAQFEPVLIFVCLPFEIARPNFQIRQRLLEEFHRALLRDGLWKGTGKRGGDILRQLLLRARALCAM